MSSEHDDTRITVWAPLCSLEAHFHLCSCSITSLCLGWEHDRKWKRMCSWKLFSLHFAKAEAESWTISRKKWWVGLICVRMFVWERKRGGERQRHLWGDKVLSVHLDSNGREDPGWWRDSTVTPKARKMKNIRAREAKHGFAVDAFCPVDMMLCRLLSIFILCMLASCWLSILRVREGEGGEGEKHKTDKTESGSALMAAHWCDMMSEWISADWRVHQVSGGAGGGKKARYYFFLNDLNLSVLRLPNRAQSQPPLLFHYLPFHTVWISHCARKHPQLHLPSLTLPHQPVYWFLSAFSHCLGRVKAGWVISPCPLFSSCTGGGTHWDCCPSDHLCTAEELDVLDSVSGAGDVMKGKNHLRNRLEGTRRIIWHILPSLKYLLDQENHVIALTWAQRK